MLPMKKSGKGDLLAAEIQMEQLRPEILLKLGRKEDALTSMWADFQEAPNDVSYEELMRYVPEGEKTRWHERAMAAADKTDLGDFISSTTMTLTAVRARRGFQPRSQCCRARLRPGIRRAG